ncbi:MAG: nitroreductase family protein [Lachnospirales bacterium]
MDIINNRRSIRSFTKVKVENEKIIELLKAGMQAPSAGNQQPWEYIIVTEETLLEQLSTLSPYSKPIKNAPLGIVVLSNKSNLKYPELQDHDLGASTQNILLKAVDLGLGSVWIGVKPIEERMKLVCDTLNIPKNLTPYCVIAIGYSDEKPHFINRFNEKVIHYNKFS